MEHMKHFAWLLLVAVLALALPSAALADGNPGPPSGTFSLGVTAAEVTSSSAILWGHADQSGPVKLVVARDRGLRRARRTYTLSARRSHDHTFARRVRGLRAGSRYYFRFSRGLGRSQRGTFVTAPSRNSRKTIEFAYSGDTDFNRAPGGRRPYWNSGGVYRAMSREGNLFNVNFGDTIYSDSEVPGILHPIALRTSQKWRKYRINLANRNLSNFRRLAGTYSHWDDHEFVNDFSPNENSFSNGVKINGHKLYSRSVRAFRDYSPVNYSKKNGIYRRFRWGRNLEVFFLDQRSFRSAKADAGGVCDNPQSGEPDLAPTAPQSKRSIFAALAPSLAQPVSKRCLDTIRSSQRTFLGKRQLANFKKAIDRSSARFKVVMNELPIQQYYALPYDRWEGYEAERQNLLRFMRDNVKNAIFLTTDVHATLVNDARLSTFPEEGGPQNTGIYDFTVGPAATANFQREIDGTLGTDGGAAALNAAFLKPPPPTGVGMRCSVLATFSYGQVKVTSKRLTVTPKDANSRPLPGCPPLTIKYSP